MPEDVKQGVCFKMYTPCFSCNGNGEFDVTFMPKVCLVCKGRGKNEKFITLEELKKLLEIVKL